MSAGYLTAQFSADDGFGSDLIRYFSIDGEWSHVDTIIPADVAARFHLPISTPYGLLGARLNGGVQLRAPNYHNFKRIARVKVMLPDLDAAYGFAFSKIGDKYDWRALVDMALHRERQFAMGANRWFCDELLYAECMAGGKLLLNTKNPLGLTPQAVYLSNCWETVK